MNYNGAIIRLPMLASAWKTATLVAHAHSQQNAMTGKTADIDRDDIATVLAGATDHFARLVDRHQGRIVSHLTRLVGHSDAEDLTQDTFVRAYQALDRYDPTYPFRGWLLVIASRLAANFVAKRREQLFGEHNESAFSAATQDPAHHVSQADDILQLQLKIDAALAQLPTESRALYELRFRQELSLAELANHFAVSENAIKVRVHRLRSHLATRLGIDLEHA